MKTSLFAVLVVLSAASLRAEVYRPAPAAGGIDSVPKLSCPIRTNGATMLTWHGPPGHYSVLTSPNVEASNWLSAAEITVSGNSNSLLITNLVGNRAFYRLAMPPNSFVGPGGCAGCHDDKHKQWMTTGHADAFSAIANLPSIVQRDCVVCHTTGAGQPTGFTDRVNTAYLLNVSCENCHGPSAAHKYGEHDIVKPIVSVASEICGGCHSVPQSPTYNEWTNSAHATVTEATRNYFLDPNPVTGFQRQMSCGACHSGATRVAMLNDYRRRQSVTNVAGGVTNITAGATNLLTLPEPQEAAAFGETCVTCHDPHENRNLAQLRNPVFSTKFFTLPTTYAQATTFETNWAGVVTTNIAFLNNVFATNYDANIQVCGQCHNTRGADWTSSGRPPHHSPQYNVLIGAVQANYLNGTNVAQVIGTRFGRDLTAIGPHGLNENGCAQCHMPAVRVENPTDSDPNYTGHEFGMRLQGCTTSGCHTSTNQAWGFMLGLQSETTNSITRLVKLLSQWSTNKAPLLTNAFAAYGKYAWEYTTAGELSNPTGTNTMTGTTNLITGPPAALQARIPATIRQARFDLYLMANDASLGVHNPEYVRYVLGHGISNVTYQLTLP